MFGFILGILAGHGYKPQQIVWTVLVTLLVFFLIFWRRLRIVGYSVESNPDKIKPIGFVFLFDRLVPAYHLREENYHIAHYFVRPRKVDSHATKTLRFFGRDLPVVEASDNDRERAERYLDILKFSGFVFAIFIAAAVSRLVR